MESAIDRFFEYLDIVSTWGGIMGAVAGVILIVVVVK